MNPELVLQQPCDYECAFTTPDPLFESDEYCAQTKLDGVKLIIFSENGDLRGESRSGRGMKLSAKTRAFMPTHGTFVVEGEQGDKSTGDTGFQAFDVISENGEDVRHLCYADRLAILATLGVPVIRTVYGAAAKRRLHVEVFANGGEGIVMKRLDAVYRPGKTSAQLKIKNWKSDTFRVTHVDGMGVELSTMAGVPCGRCAGYANAGALVEVRFQEVTEAGKLRCPTIIGTREDLE